MLRKFEPDQKQIDLDLKQTVSRGNISDYLNITPRIPTEELNRASNRTKESRLRSPIRVQIQN